MPASAVSSRPHVTVIGAGLVGLASARALLNAGHRVRLIDRCDAVGQGASARNGAQLSYAYVAPLASPALWHQLPSLLLKPDSPLRLSPRGVLQDLRWCLAFLAACRGAAARRTTVALLELAALSRRELERWRDEGGAPDVRQNGKLVLLPDAAAFASARTQMALQARLGCQQQALDADACRRLEPALADAATPFAGGIHTPGECVVDPMAMSGALLAALQRHPDFELRLGCEVIGARRRNDSVEALRLAGADDLPVEQLVLAGGPGSAALARRLDLSLPVAPMKGYSIDLPADALTRWPTVSITDSARRVVFAPLLDGECRRLRVAGMAELVGQDLRIDPRRIAQLVEATDAWFGLRVPAEAAVQNPWAGLRPATPSGLPCIGRFGGLRNVYANAGHGPLGLTLAMGSAALLVSAMQRRAAAINPLPYAAGPLAWV